MLKPIFCVVLSDGDNWSVKAEWPDGTIEPVDTFEGPLGGGGLAKRSIRKLAKGTYRPAAHLRVVGLDPTVACMAPPREPGRV